MTPETSRTYREMASRQTVATGSRSRDGKGTALLRLLFCVLLSTLVSIAASGRVHADVAGNTFISNQAQATYLDSGQPQFNKSNVDTMKANPTGPPATISFFRFAGGAQPDVTLNLPLTGFSHDGNDTGAFTKLPPPVEPGHPPLDLGKLKLRQSDLFHAGDPVFILVTDAEHNIRPGLAETIVVEITSSAGDKESLQLVETGEDTGIFAGYVQTHPMTAGAPAGYDGKLAVTDASQIVARYSDSWDKNEVVTAAALVDPAGVVFDSITGKPVNGVTVTLIDESTGKPAAVIGDDGTSAFPATVTAGGTVSDAGGKSYQFAPGGYRFPLIYPGTYRLAVTPPVGYRGPSIVPDATLQTLPGAPFFLSAPSRGEAFVVNPGPIIHIDVPLDPVPKGLWVEKAAGKATAAIGDFVPFRIKVTNLDPDHSATAVALTDLLPHGMRYQPGSLRLDGKPAAAPTILPDGTTLTIPLGTLVKSGKAEISYVTQIVAGARIGASIKNRAYADGAGVTSNKADASVTIIEDFLTSRAIIMGTITEGPCGLDGTGVEGIRIYLENGTYVISDKKGMFHFEGIRPGTHVVQLDVDSLPEGYRVIPCEENSRFAGRAYSQFVDVQGGTVWRTDFRVGKVARKERLPDAPPLAAPTPANEASLMLDEASGSSIDKTKDERPDKASVEFTPARGEVRIELTSGITDDTIHYRTGMWGRGIPLTKVRLAVTLPAEVKYQPGSSSLDGAPLADPEVAGSVLTYAIGSAPEEWAKALRFDAVIEPACRTAELLTKAVMTVDTLTHADQSTPLAENLLNRYVEEHRNTMPAIILYPHFPTFGARLGDRDKQVLDELAANLSGLQIESIAVSGHTDNVPIAKRSRSLYPDNTALSMARAKSVGRYLLERLQLPPSVLDLNGKGESMPIASNRTHKGRALNRRVEIVVRSYLKTEKTRNELIKKESGILKRAVAGTASTPGGPEVIAEGVPDSGEGASVQGIPLKPQPEAEKAASLHPPNSEDFDLTQEAADSALEEEETVAPPPVSAPEAAESPETAARRGGEDEVVVVPPQATAEDTEAGGAAAEDEELPSFDMAWIENVHAGREWVWPPPVYYPAIPSTHIALKHDPRDKVTLTVNGTEVAPVLLEKVLKHPNGSVSVSYWRGIPLRDGDNTVVAVLQPENGSEPVTFSRNLHVSTAPVRGEVVPELCNLAADGKTSPVIALRLFDKDDYPIRQGMTGRYWINPPHQAYVDRETTKMNDLMAQDETKYVVGKEGVIIVSLEPTNSTGEAVVTVPLGDSREEQFRVWLTPQKREWILVGLAEGTTGYNTIAGHMENLRSAGGEDAYYDDGRISFFAKGTVQGKWLLTMAYDSAKERSGNAGNLFQTIDPNNYYTLYGDNTQQQYDAASIRKLYLRIERDQFYALFGDYNTGLTVTELSRYSRSLNGLKTEYQGQYFELNAFASETGQSFARDEIRGDGTSGLYHLSRKNILTNSEKISIITRDRFRSEIIISSTSLTRYLDYSIDYDAGALFFKEPIASKDLNFNPTYIVVEYETLDVSSESLNYGGRGGFRFMDGKIRAGASHVHEEQIAGQGNLYGLDASWQIGLGTRLRTEVAGTDSDSTGTAREGMGYLAELEHRDRKLESRIYYREQEDGFGIGQQSAGEAGTRKFGLDAVYKVRDSFTLGSTGYRQYTLTSGAVRDVAEGKATHSFLDHSTRFGLRYAGDTLPDGTTQASEQVTLGATWLTLKKRLSLHVDHDQSIGGNSNIDFPTRTTFGADYKITDATTIMGQQEFTSGESISTEGTRIGIRSNPWEGGAVNTSMEQQFNENSARLFALFGIKQNWKLSKEWGVGAALDRTQTLRRSGSYTLNENVPPASGGEDFTAASLGTSYLEKKWNWSTRVEYRTSDSEDKWGVLSSFVGEPAEGWGWSARLQVFDAEATSGLSRINSDLRLGLVHRPFGTRIILLDRLDLLFDQQEGPSADMNSRRIVNNFSLNIRPLERMQVSLYYGAKYVLEKIDGTDYSGYTDNPGAEMRYDMTKKLDAGIRCSLLHTWRSGEISYSTGPSVGYNIMENAWLSVGYNVLGFADKDFSRADYTAQGPYIKFRVKFDQNSVQEAVRMFSSL